MAPSLTVHYRLTSHIKPMHQTGIKHRKSINPEERRSHICFNSRKNATFPLDVPSIKAKVTPTFMQRTNMKKEEFKIGQDFYWLLTFKGNVITMC